MPISTAILFTLFVSPPGAPPATSEAPAGTPHRSGVEIRASMTDDALAGVLANNQAYGTHLRLQAMGSPRASWQRAHLGRGKLPFAALRFGGTFGIAATTPTDIELDTIDRDDRPYVGYTYGGFIVEFTDGMRNRVIGEIDYGAIGKQSGAGAFHRSWKAAIGGAMPRGWQYQVRNELHFNFMVDWDRELLRALPVGQAHLVDVQTHAKIELAELAIAASAGATARFGLLRRPFVGVANVNADAALDRCKDRQCRTRNSVQVFVYMRGDAGPVWRRTSVDGSLFDRERDDDRSPHRAHSRPFVARGEVGIVVQPVHNVGLQFALQHIGPEVDAPGSDPHTIGRASVVVRF